MWAIAVFLAMAISYLAYEYISHQRWLRRIPIRVHVNGTRGKSSVTRLIAAGLRAGGLRTLAKTTGSLPRIIDENGQDVPIIRRGRTNIIEQRMVVREAAKRHAEALVIECMAVDPELQLVHARKMIRPTVGVITNVRPDHLDVMGPKLENVAYSLSNTIPLRGVLLTGEKAMISILRDRAIKLGTEVKVTDQGEITDEMMAGFCYLEHKENIALALAVCQHLGVDREVALKGMYACIPDPGVLKVSSLSHSGKRIRFVNAFKANDPFSTLRVWRLVNSTKEWPGSQIAVINTRPDRVQRSQQFVELMLEGLKADFFVLTGAAADLMERVAIKTGLNKNMIVNLGKADARSAIQKILDLTTEWSTIFCMGNIAGFGLELVDYFSKKDDGKYGSFHYGFGASN